MISQRLEDIANRLTTLRQGGSGAFAQSLLLINFVVLFLRPNDVVAAIGAIRLPMIISIICMFTLLPVLNQAKPFAMKVLLIFIGVECFRLVVGYYIFEDFVVNDFWQAQTLKDLGLQYFGLVFPMMFYFRNGRAFRRLSKAWWLVAFLLPIYVITHGGTGPGGFLGDENDVGLAILFFMSPIIAQLFETKTGGTKKFLKLLACLVTFVAVVVTNSRGTFVGLVAVLSYFFWLSRRKISILLLLIAVLAIATPFIPDSYIKRLSSIADTNKGTAEIRRYYWTLAWKVFVDPKNILTGVGLENTRYSIGKYEDPDELKRRPGSAGRSVHSIYFQLLPDLGVWGITIVGLLVFRAQRSNSRFIRLTKYSLRELSEIESRLKRQLSLEGGTERALQLNRSLEIVTNVSAETSYLRGWLLGMNVGLIAIFSAGAFISVLYYPMLWVAIGLSAGLSFYANDVLSIVEDLEKTFTEQVS